MARPKSTVLLGLLILATSALSAEVSDEMIQRYLSSKNTSTSLDNSGGSASYNPVDNSIDADRYVVGSGDKFSISIIDMPSTEYLAEINQNCDVYIAGLGVLKLGPVSLRDAREAISRFVGQKLRGKSEIYVTFSAAKMVQASVVGVVAAPGSYAISGTKRISDLISLANKNSLPALGECDFRAVEIRNHDSIRTVDLFPYLLRNDLQSNPYVYSGDHVRIVTAPRRVYVSGEIRSLAAGMVPIKQHETAQEFLSLFALSDLADSNAIFIQQGPSAFGRTQKQYSWSELSTVTLQDNDVILVAPKANAPRVDVVAVTGEVLRPGQYAISSGKTTVQQAVDLAGGPTERGSMGDVFVLRNSKKMSEVLRQQALSSPVGLKPSPELGSIRPEMNLAFDRLLYSSDYTFFSVRDATKPLLLEASDQIIVPKIETMVYLSGSVKKPGAYPFSPGQTIQHYVSLAGGYGSKADRGNTYVMTIDGTAFRILGTRTVAAGDVIVVPDDQRNRAFATIFLPVFQAVATTVTVIIGIITLTR